MQRNPIAKQVTRIRPQVVLDKREKAEAIFHGKQIDDVQRELVGDFRGALGIPRSHPDDSKSWPVSFGGENGR